MAQDRRPAGKKSAAGRGNARRQPPRQPGRSGNPAKRAGAAGSGAGRPPPPGKSFFTPGASPTRLRIERGSAPLLVLFHRMPRPVFAALPLLLLVLGAFVPVLPLALLCLALAVLLLGWLAYLSWPRTAGPQKLMRLVVPLLVVAVGVLRITRG
ncbi:MAG: hypothetical protein QOH99_72 [Frankiaceae bacterium]|nr:hypothetical protein [Frankiaceae bacterium]